MPTDDGRCRCCGKPPRSSRCWCALVETTGGVWCRTHDQAFLRSAWLPVTAEDREGGEHAAD